MESAGPLGRMLLAGSVDLFDLLPAPVLLVELGSGRILFANAAAQALAGGEYPPGLAERVARGERIASEPIDWDARTLVVSGGGVVMPDGERVGMVTIDDVTEIEGARRRPRCWRRRAPRSRSRSTSSRRCARSRAWPSRASPTAASSSSSARTASRCRPPMSWSSRCAPAGR